MKYFAAVKLPINTHIAWTRFVPDQHVRVDLTREQAFAMFNQMPEVVVFDNAESAKRYADHMYYATAKRNSNGFFPENPIKRSNDEQLLNIYGREDGVVRMQVQPTVVLFQLEGDDQLKNKCENVRHDDEIYRGYKVAGEDKQKLVIEMVGVPGIVGHFSDAAAKQNKCKTTEELVNHREQTNKRGIFSVLSSLISHR